MYPTFLLLAVALWFGIGKTFVVPEGTPNGLYVTFRDAGGLEQTKSLNVSTTYIPDSRAISPADGGFTAQSSCVILSLNHNDVDCSVQSLRDYCGNGRSLAGATFFWYVNGTAVSYICVYPTTGATCTASSVSSAFNTVAQSCGSYVAGWGHKWQQRGLWIR